MDWPLPSPEADRQAGNSPRRKARGDLGPDGSLHQTVSRLPAANQVFLGSCAVDIYQEGRSLRSAPQRRHTAHLRWRSCCAPRKLSGWHQGGIRYTVHLGRVHSPSTQSPELLGPGGAQNAGPTEFVPLWSTGKPEPEWLRSGRCTQPRAHIGQFPSTATWSLNSVDQESPHAMSCGKPSVVHTL